MPTSVVAIIIHACSSSRRDCVGKPGDSCKATWQFSSYYLIIRSILATWRHNYHIMLFLRLLLLCGAYVLAAKTKEDKIDMDKTLHIAFEG